MPNFLKRTITALIAVPSMYWILSGPYHWVFIFPALILCIVECHLEINIPVVKSHGLPSLLYPLPLICLLTAVVELAALSANSALLVSSIVGSVVVLLLWTLLVQVGIGPLDPGITRHSRIFHFVSVDMQHILFFTCYITR